MVFGDYFNPNWQPYFLALVGGIFLHISSVIIFESNKNHKMDWQKLFLVIAGVGLALVNHLFHSSLKIKIKQKNFGSFLFFGKF